MRDKAEFARVYYYPEAVTMRRSCYVTWYDVWLSPSSGVGISV